MSIQILGLRTFEKNGEKVTTDCYHKKLWRAPDIPTLFRDIDSYLAQIPVKDHWNLFYTLAQCSEKKRDFARQTVIAFDIDGVPEEERRSAGLVAIGALGLDPAKTALVSSGGGLHVVVELQTPITSRDFFKEFKPAYGGACDRIASALKKAGLTAKIVDPVVFEPRRILRLPGTENRKEGKPARKCHLLQSTLSPQEFNLADFFPTGAPVKKNDAIPARAFARYGATDTAAVLQGCDFLKWAKAEPMAVNEPQWYAALSITARLTAHEGKDGATISHELSSGHPGYDQDTTDKKIAQALDASGPRTCHNINALWGRCSECPHFEKVGSPIQLVSPDKIPTELTGFHQIMSTGKAVPSTEDLRRYLKREHQYRTVAGARTMYGWNGKLYEPWEHNEIEEFAHRHFEPKVDPSIMRKFRELAGATEIVKSTWFNDSTKGKINFQNGVLDIDSGDFEPHDARWGFRYALPYDYDPAAKAPLFEATLRRITGGDAGITSLIAEVFGYCLSGSDYWHHKAIVFQGDGSNGKSTITKVLELLAGTGNHSAVSIKNLDDEYQRQMLDGKLFNISDETPSKSLLDTSYFKQLTSFSSVTARTIYERPYLFRNRAKFILNCNALPDSFDTSYGLIRRLVIVPFTQLITKETIGADFDPFLEAKLEKELSGIFNLALEGYRRMQRQGGFTECAAVTFKVREFELETNTVKSWFENEVTSLTNGHSETFVPMDDLYEHYKLKVKAHEMRPVKYLIFCKELRKIIPHFEKHFTRERHPKTGQYAQKKTGLKGYGLVRDFGDEEHEAEKGAGSGAELC